MFSWDVSAFGVSHGSLISGFTSVFTWESASGFISKFTFPGERGFWHLTRRSDFGIKNGARLIHRQKALLLNVTQMYSLNAFKVSDEMKCDITKVSFTDLDPRNFCSCLGTG